MIKVSENAMFVALTTIVSLLSSVPTRDSSDYQIASSLCFALLNRDVKSEKDKMKILFLNFISRLISNDEIECETSMLLMEFSNKNETEAFKGIVGQDMTLYFNDSNALNETMAKQTLGFGIKFEHGYKELDNIGLDAMMLEK